MGDAQFGEFEPAASVAEARETGLPATRSSQRRPGLRLPANRKVLAIGGLALLLALGAGAWFLLRLRGDTAPAAAASGASLEDAMALFRDGKVPETIAMLRRIPPGHPDHDRARNLLASLTSAPASSASAAPAAKPGPEAAARPGVALENDPARLRAAAEQALEEKRYIEALKNFNLAAPSFANDPAFAQARARATEKVTALTPAVKLYNEADYETAIPILWRIHSEDHENRDARSYLERAYFNQGIAQLQNGLYGRAKESFREVLVLSPQDEMAARHRKFAERYESRDLDLMGRIYVRHVQQRH
jgi:tetratricopeptide (TPR) repeat protein